MLVLVVVCWCWSSYAGVGRRVLLNHRAVILFYTMSCPFLNPVIINHLSKKKLIDTLHKKSYGHGPCDTKKCGGSLRSLQPRMHGETRTADELLSHAREFIDEFYRDISKENSQKHRTRIRELEESVSITGTYDLLEEELIFGARQAWRNSPRCIGRRDWKSLEVLDARGILTPQDMFDALCHHIAYATNKGNIRPVLTVFPQSQRGRPDCRIWNCNLISYAGYKVSGSQVRGDPANVEITEVAIKLGWKPKWGNFDVLPLIISVFGEVQVFELPIELVLEVAITHPTLSFFEELGLKWYGLNSVSHQLLDCGGIVFPACPFTGWFLGTTIGSQALCGSQRYNLTEVVALKMGLDTKDPFSMWREHVLIETNMAVLSSFEEAGVSIINHHDASDSFICHLEDEYKVRGGCPADWAWIVPPMSQSTLQVFHQEMMLYYLLPGFFHQEAKPWKNYRWPGEQSAPKPKSYDNEKRRFTFRAVGIAIRFATHLRNRAVSNRIQCTILYGTETGKSEMFANRLCDILSKAFQSKVICMNEFEVQALVNERLVIIITSTFGNGEPPENGKQFADDLLTLKGKHFLEHGFTEKIASLNTAIKMTSDTVPLPTGTNTLAGISGPLANTRFSVFGLGSNAYPHFAIFGKYLYKTFEDLGAISLVDYHTGDACHGQEESFRTWSREVFKASCRAFCLGEFPEEQYDITEKSWSHEQVRLVPVEYGKEPELCDALLKIHGKKAIPSILMDRTQLQAKESEWQTILVRLVTDPTSDLMYSPGDHVAIFPSNSPEIVRGILDRLDRDIGPLPDQIVRTDVCTQKGIEKTWTSHKKLPICSLLTSFSFLLDINTPPTQEMLLLMASFASSDIEKQRLELLATNLEDYIQWCTEQRPNILEVIEEFSSLKIPASFLLTQLPLLQPRLYSISSSPQLYPKELHLTIGVVKYRTKGGTGSVHEGVCSSWLNRSPTGTVVRCFIRKTPNFHMPVNSSLPIIMIGSGTGIAPYRSFWQEKKIEFDALPRNNREKFGEMILYSGCRTVNEIIYANELDEIKQSGILSNFWALSREPNLPKMHVQDILLQNAAVVFEKIKKGAHIYLSGSASMASDITRALEAIIQQEGRMTAQHASNFMTNLMDENKIHVDIFGAHTREHEESRSRDQTLTSKTYQD